MKRAVLVLALIACRLCGFTQENESKFDLRFGTGTSLLGTGDINTLMFENEINLTINKIFSISTSLSYAKSDKDEFLKASFIQLNSNVYISPFRNNRSNDFRIGTGISWYSVSDVYESFTINQNGELLDLEYEFDKRKSIGLNIIIEDTYTFSDKYLLGVKLFSQPYQNGDINSGVLLKIGVKI